jgi:hypothetical protein
MEKQDNDERTKTIRELSETGKFCLISKWISHYFFEINAPTSWRSIFYEKLSSKIQQISSNLKVSISLNFLAFSTPRGENVPEKF